MELNKILLKTIKDVKNKPIRVYTVNGTFVRDNKFIGFVEGGHHFVSKDYEFIPKSEIWIEENMNEKDRLATILHENHERNNMLYNNLTYNKAHDKANIAEKKFRKTVKIEQGGQVNAHDIALKSEVEILKDGEVAQNTTKEAWEMTFEEYLNYLKKNQIVKFEFDNDAVKENHKTIIKQALSENKNVQIEVLNDYPDLKELSLRNNELRENKMKTKKYKKIPSEVLKFMPLHQQKTVNSNINEFQDAISNLLELINKLPKTYGTDGQGDNAIAYLHYFHGSQDWYITEQDIENEQKQAFGLVNLFGDFELGYVNIEEIKESNKIELDFYWNPKTLAEIKGIEQKAEQINEIANITIDPKINSKELNKLLDEKFKILSTKEFSEYLDYIRGNVSLKESHKNDFQATKRRNTISNWQSKLNDAIESEVREKSNDNPSTESKQRFLNIKEVDRSEITVMPELFQGRQHAYSEESVSKIVSEGFDKSNDPIIVWFNTDINKYVVISGHSRWEASKRLYEKGDVSLQTMPIKEFLGDKEEAISYAVLESNRASTQEGLISDINAVRKMLNEGFNKTEMLKYIKPKSYLENVISYTYLNPNGKFIEYLAQPSHKSFPYLERNAIWIGELRKNYKDKLTDLHENEIFEYIYQSGSSKGLRLNKDEFYNLIDSKVMKIDFDSNKPLNLNNVVSVSSITDPVRQRIKELKDDIEYFNKEIVKKQDLIVRARQEGKPELISNFEKFISEATNKIISLKESISKLESDMIQLEQSTVHDLWSSAEESPIMEHIEAEITKKEGQEALDNAILESKEAVIECNNELVHFSNNYNKEILQVDSKIIINGFNYKVVSLDSEKIKLKSNLGRFNKSEEMILAYDEAIKMFNDGKIVFDGYAENDKSLFDLMLKSKQICIIRDEAHKGVSGIANYSIEKIVSLTNVVNNLISDKEALENTLSEVEAKNNEFEQEKEAKILAEQLESQRLAEIAKQERKESKVKSLIESEKQAEKQALIDKKANKEAKKQNMLDRIDLLKEMMSDEKNKVKKLKISDRIDLLNDMMSELEQEIFDCGGEIEAFEKGGIIHSNIIEKIKDGSLKKLIQDKIQELLVEHQDEFRKFSKIRKITNEAYVGQGLTESDLDSDDLEYLGFDKNEMVSASYDYFMKTIKPIIENIRSEIEGYLSENELERLIRLELDHSNQSYSVYLKITYDGNLDEYIQEHNLDISESDLQELIEDKLGFDVRFSDHEDRHYQRNRVNIDYSDRKYYFEKGGKIPNLYENKTPEQIWDMWDSGQKQHFLQDHKKSIITDENINVVDVMSEYNKAYNDLSEIVKDRLRFHLLQGQYKEGGRISGLKVGDIVKINYTRTGEDFNDVIITKIVDDNNIEGVDAIGGISAFTSHVEKIYKESEIDTDKLKALKDNFEKQMEIRNYLANNDLSV